jgi:hypothetical protein
MALRTIAKPSRARRLPGPKLSAADIADIECLIERQTQRLREIE